MEGNVEHYISHNIDILQMVNQLNGSREDNKEVVGKEWRKRIRIEKKLRKLNSKLVEVDTKVPTVQQIIGYGGWPLSISHNGPMKSII